MWGSLASLAGTPVKTCFRQVSRVPAQGTSSARPPVPARRFPHCRRVSTTAPSFFSSCTISILPPMGIVLIQPFFKKVNEVALASGPAQHPAHKDCQYAAYAVPIPVVIRPFVQEPHLLLQIVQYPHVFPLGIFYIIFPYGGSSPGFDFT